MSSGKSTRAESSRRYEPCRSRDFKEIVQARAERDPAFEKGWLKEGVECLLAGDVDTGKIVLCDYINATIGIEELGSPTNKPPKSLMRMFGPSGQSPRPQPVRGHQPVFISTRVSSLK